MWLLALSTGLLLWMSFSAGGVLPAQFYAASAVFAMLAFPQVLRWATRREGAFQAPPLSITVPAGLLLGYLVLQCVPLPRSWALALWPARAETFDALHEAGMPMQAAWYTISLRPAATVDVAIHVMVALCVFVIAYSLMFRSRLTLQGLLLPVVILGIAQAALALAAAPPGSTDTVVSGSFVNRNHFASLLALSLPLTVAFGARAGMEALHDESRALRNALAAVCWFGAAGVQLFALVLSQSRGGFLAALCGLGVFGLLFVMRMHTARRRYVLLGVGGALALLLVAVPTPQLAERFIQNSSPDGITAGMRTEIWEKSLALFRRHWVVGVGAGAFEDAFTPFNSFAAGKRVDYAHNDYLQLLVELGVIGTVPVLALAGALAARVMEALARTAGDGVLLLFAGAGSLAAFAVHETVEFNFAIPVLALLVAWVGGVMCGQAVLLRLSEASARQSFAIGMKSSREYAVRGGAAEA